MKMTVIPDYYTIEELKQLQVEISKAIEKKQKAEYDSDVAKFMDALKILSEKYPYDTAFDYEYEDRKITWEELYNDIHEYVY